MRTIIIEGIKMTIQYVRLATPYWDDTGALHDTYEVTLFNPAAQEEFTFSFYDSVHKTLKKLGSRENDNAFISSLLECIDNDLNSEDGCRSFESYCDNYGFDKYSMKDFRSYELTIRHVNGLKRVIGDTDFDVAVYDFLFDDDEYGVGLILNPAAQSKETSCIAECGKCASICDMSNLPEEEPVETDWKADYQRWIDGGRK